MRRYALMKGSIIAAAEGDAEAATGPGLARLLIDEYR
jgi:hypothetical protein